jgi:TolA-binding protein
MGCGRIGAAAASVLPFPDAFEEVLAMRRYFAVSALLLAIAAGLVLSFPEGASTQERLDDGLRALPEPEIPAAIRPRLSAEGEALLAIREDGRRQVQQIAAEMAGLQDAERIRQLQGRIQDIKKQTRIRFLEEKIRFASERGDHAVEAEAQRLIDRLRNPPRPEMTAPVRQTPDKAEAAEGGRS